MKSNILGRFKQWLLSIDTKGSSNIKTEDMTLYEKWQEARNMFMYYAIRFTYDTGDGYHRTVSTEERKYCREMANLWEKQIEIHRNQIMIAKSEKYAD